MAENPRHAQPHAEPGAKPDQDPKSAAPQPPMPQQHQSPPGHEGAMNPKPDYGEHSYRGSGRLAGKAAIVTGGDSGIGRAVALAFAREGADVAISYLEQEQRDADETRRVVEAAGRRCLLIPGDIRNEEHCIFIVNRTVETFGRLDILVNNAAFQSTHEDITEITTDLFDRVFRTNVYAPFWLSRAALPLMREGGAIINTASVEAYQPEPTLLHYASTKGAIVAFTKGLAKQAIKRGVRVNAVAPGPVWTPLIPSTMPEQQVKKFGSSSPIGRAAQPAELAPVYVLLAFNEGSYINGAIYAVTGGSVTA